MVYEWFMNGLWMVYEWIVIHPMEILWHKVDKVRPHGEDLVVYFFVGRMGEYIY